MEHLSIHICIPDQECIQIEADPDILNDLQTLARLIVASLSHILETSDADLRQPSVVQLH